jgi:hypothetical protein
MMVVFPGTEYFLASSPVPKYVSIVLSSAIIDPASVDYGAVLALLCHSSMSFCSWVALNGNTSPLI